MFSSGDVRPGDDAGRPAGEISDVTANERFPVTSSALDGVSDLVVQGSRVPGVTLLNDRPGSERRRDHHADRNCRRDREQWKTALKRYDLGKRASLALPPDEPWIDH
jgi:hypothetical protein